MRQFIARHLWRVAPRLHVGAVNFAAVGFVLLAWILVLGRLVSSPGESLLLAAGFWGKFIIFGVPVAIASALGIWQAIPLARVRYRPGDAAALAAARRVALQAPLFQASLAFVGWSLGTAGWFAVAWIDAVPLSASRIARVAISAILMAMLHFSIVYYWLEFILRRFYIPRLFPHGGLSREQWNSPLSVRFRFYLFYFATCAFPVVTFYAAIRAQMAEADLARIESLLNVAAAGVLLFGAWLTFIVSSGYQRPLVEMKAAVGRVRGGDFDVRVRVTSDDELGALGDGLNEMTAGLKEREMIRSTFGRLVGPSIRDHLLGGHLELGGEVRDAAVMFVDIRGFTSLSETMQPGDVVRLLNFYFDRLGNCIAAERGVLNKYIGDAMMAVFGAPLALDRPAAAAVRAAEGMRAAMGGLNADLARDGLPPLHIGIGIHAGPVLAGNIGSAERMEYTVIGDTVNLASRVEGLCKSLACDLLLTEGVKERLQTHADALGERLEPVSTQTVRGRQKPVRLYTIRAQG